MNHIVFSGLKRLLLSLALTLVVSLFLFCGGCHKQAEAGGQVSSPAAMPTQQSAQQQGQAKPYVPVPPLREYDWLKKANILLGRAGEIAVVKKKVEDYYSGYPTFLKVLKIITRDRNVGVKDNPVYLTDVFHKYYELAGVSEDAPLVAVEEFDLGIMKNALYLSWKKENQFSPIDNYDDMVTRVEYEK